MMGCASTPQQNPKPTEAEIIEQVIACNEHSDIPEDYPWSIPGYHDTVSAQDISFGITQARETPDQFTFCTDCPCPTSKALLIPKTYATTTRSQTKAASNLKKTVIHFDNASYALGEKQYASLSRVYQSLPDSYRLTITGYTDNTTSGGNVTNEALAQQRARAVLDFLIELGVNEQHTTVKATPLCCYIAPNTTDSGRAFNRRTEIIITTTYPQQTEGKQP